MKLLFIIIALLFTNTYSTVPVNDNAKLCSILNLVQNQECKDDDKPFCQMVNRVEKQLCHSFYNVQSTCSFKSSNYCVNEQGQKVSIRVDSNDEVDIYADIFGMHKHCHEHISCDGNKVNLPSSPNDCTKTFMSELGAGDVSITYNNANDTVDVSIGSGINVILKPC